jgi:hypothetical protein
MLTLAEHSPFPIENGSTRAARADIDRNHVITHQL